MSESARSFDRLIIPAPCDADWESMIGNDQVRFCEHCNLHVTNLSSITRQEAMRLVTRSQGRLCVRFRQRPNGSVITKQMPRKVHQIARRVSRLAAGAFSATLSLSSAAAQSAQSQLNVPDSAMRIVPERKGIASDSHATISGTLTDQNGAVIPGANITLVNTGSGAERNTTSSDEGLYIFENLPAGTYTLRIRANGFKNYEIQNIALEAGTSQTQDASLEVGAIAMGVMVFAGPEEPLVKAAFEEDVEAVEELAFASPDVNVRDKNTNMTALDQAVEKSNLEIVRTLLRAGANVNAKNDNGATPLMFLRDGASVDLVRELLTAGAKVTARDESGGTALMNAASDCKYDVVKELIDAGAGVEPKDANGNTALIFAAKNDDPRITKLLIDVGAELNAKDVSGKTALMTASDEGDPETVKLLISFSASVNDVDDDGWSALMYAANTTDAVSVEALLNAGADVSLRNKDGETALAIARKSERQEIIKLLESRGAPE